MAELPAELTIKTNAEVTLVPMLIRPGDTVVIPIDHRMGMAETDELTDHLTSAMPGVKWRFVEGTPMQHALVYRPEDRVELRYDRDRGIVAP